MTSIHYPLEEAIDRAIDLAWRQVIVHMLRGDFMTARKYQHQAWALQRARTGEHEARLERRKGLR